MLNRKGQKRKGLSALHLGLEMIAQELLTRLQVALQVVLPPLRLGGKRKLFMMHTGIAIDISFVMHSVFEHRKGNKSDFSFFITRRGAKFAFDIIERQRQVHIVEGDSCRFTRS